MNKINKDNRYKIFQISSVIKKYTLGKVSFTALKGITFSIGKGELVSIMGPSGSGKSTLLHLMGCLDVPTSGKIIIDNVDVSNMDEDALAEIRLRKIGFIFQQFNLFSNISVSRNIELPLMLCEVDRSIRKERVEKILDVVGLSDKANNNIYQLSGGEMQRVAIARALVNNPSIILADEPTGNLDSQRGKEIMDFIHTLWKKNKLTVVLVTHDINIAKYAQRIIYLRDGLIEKEEILKNSKVSV